MQPRKLFSNEARVGVVIIAALLLLTWLTFQVGDFRFGRKGYLIEAVFKTVSGLEEKAKVRIAGVLVGSVDRVFLRDGLAHVLIRLNDDAVVREDSVVSIASIGLLAEFYIDITAGSQTARKIRPGEVVVGKELIDLNQLVAQLAEVAGTVKTLAGRISETWGGKDSSVARLMNNFDALVDRVNGLVDANRAGIHNAIAQIGGLTQETRGLVADNREELRATIANLRDFSATLNQRATDLSTQITATAADLRGAVAAGREDLKTLMDTLRSAAAKAERAADSLNSILQKVDTGQGTIGRLVNDAGTLTGINRAVDQIGGVAEKINTGQGSLGRLVTDDKLIGKLETSVTSLNNFLTKADKIHLFLGYRGEYLARGGDLKNYVSVKIQPQPDKYYFLELVDDPAGKRSTTETTTEVQQSDGTYSVSEKTTVDDLSKLKYTVQFAKSYGDFTFRGGLLESRGGISLDYQPGGNALRFTVEGWDFGRDKGPHLKFTGRYQLYKDLYLNAGVDDWLESGNRSAFLGAGILFSDEDLKYFLTLSSFGK